MPRKRARNFRRDLSAGAVVFRDTTDGREYLLLEPSPTERHRHATNARRASLSLESRSEKEYWTFPKGHVETGETPQEAALREIREETGLVDIEFVPGFEQKVHYFFREGDTLISKDVIYLLGRTKRDTVKISFEHKGFGWFDYPSAIKKITYNKEVLEVAEEYLKQQALW